jgi:hypothetical protein
MIPLLPLVPLGCKAIIYEDGDTRDSWASRGVKGWYLGPSKDHYHCDMHYIIETCAYHASGLTELFPQHCQMPNSTPHQHLQALTDKLTQATTLANQTTNGRQLIKYLGKQSNVCQTLSSSSRNKGQRRHCSCEYRQRNKG